jgi:hypothetical protein
LKKKDAYSRLQKFAVAEDVVADVDEDVGE